MYDGICMYETLIVPQDPMEMVLALLRVGRSIKEGKVLELGHTIQESLRTDENCFKTFVKCLISMILKMKNDEMAFRYTNQLIILYDNLMNDICEFHKCSLALLLITPDDLITQRYPDDEQFTALLSFCPQTN